MNSYRVQQGRKPAKRNRLPTLDVTREKLMKVAGPIFADRGYQATTIREICGEAGANVAAVNYHFGDKLGFNNRDIAAICASCPA
jgi:AcrR family transcriptional regulator